MSLCKSGCKGDYIIGRYQAIVNAVNKAKAGVKAVREACVECLSELEGLRARMVAESRGGGEDGDGEEEEGHQEFDIHDILEPPAIKFDTEYEPDLEGDGVEDEEEDDDDSVMNPEGRKKKLKAAKEAEEEVRLVDGGGTAVHRVNV